MVSFRCGFEVLVVQQGVFCILDSFGLDMRELLYLVQDPWHLQLVTLYIQHLSQLMGRWKFGRKET